MAYTVEIKRSAEKEMDRLPAKIHKNVSNRILALENNPRPPGAIKLQGGDGYRLRAGDYRVLYTIDDQTKRVFDPWRFKGLSKFINIREPGGM